MKKKINILLIIAVVALWGGVGYRFLNNYFFTNDKNLSIKSNNNLDIKNLTVVRDTFSLEPITRDPFLNRFSEKEVITKPVVGVSKTKKILKPKLPVMTTAVFWPDIQYFGYIKSAKNNELALVKINGKLLRLHKGESRDNVTVKNVYKDSIEIHFNKEKKVFKHI